MRVLRPDGNLDAFFELLRGSASRALILDYDGTIAPFCETRHEAIPHPAVLTALNLNLAGGHTQVAIVSGRAIDDLLPLLAGLTKRPEIWGSHGWERMRADGSREVFAIPETAGEALSLARERAAEFMDRCEIKPTGIAVHWRGMERVEADALLAKVEEAWRELSHIPGGDQHRSSSDICSALEWHEFDGGVELRAVGRNKGDAVRAIVEAMEHDSVIAYAGDDRTDEDAFAAVGVGGHGVSLLVRREFRETCAAVWLESHDELAEFLTRWNRVCTTKR